MANQIGQIEYYAMVAEMTGAISDALNNSLANLNRLMGMQNLHPIQADTLINIPQDRINALITSFEADSDNVFEGVDLVTIMLGVAAITSLKAKFENLFDSYVEMLNDDDFQSGANVKMLIAIICETFVADCAAHCLALINTYAAHGA